MLKKAVISGSLLLSIFNSVTSNAETEGSNVFEKNDLLRNDATVFEAEKGITLGSSIVYEDQSAFKSGGVAYISELGSGFKIRHVPKSNFIAIRYSSINDGAISLYINGKKVEKLNFTSSGAWVTNYNFATIKIPVKHNSDLELRYDDGDTALNVDQVIVSNSLWDLNKIIYAEKLMDKVANGANESSVGTKNNTGKYNRIEENSDNFESEKLEWNILNPNKLHNSEIIDGRLVLWSTPYSAWLDKMRGVHIHKLIKEDNFKVTADLEVTDASGGDLSVSTMPFTQAGIMLRKADKENHAVFFHGSMGLSDEPGLKAEYKNTIEDVSVWEFLEWNHSRAEIRICRFNNKITHLMRPKGGDWVLIHEGVRKDMSGEVYVGPVIYAHNPKPDIRAHYDYINFEPLKRQSDCMK